MVVTDSENILVARYEWYDQDIFELKLVVGCRAVIGNFERTQGLPLQEVEWELVQERKYSSHASLKSIKHYFQKSAYFLHQRVMTIWSGVCHNAQT